MGKSSIKVVCVSSDVYNLDDLKQMTKEEIYDLANVDISTGGDSCEISSLDEFSQLFNAGYVDPAHSYIFFVDTGE